MFNSLSDMLSSREYDAFIDDRLGNQLFLDDPERANRIHKAAESCGDGSYHAEVIQDWRDFLDTLDFQDSDEHEEDYGEKARDSISKEIDDKEQWHKDNGTLWEMIG